eukprot:scaffold12578_cov30-Tisochrysis_lutea.AAC.3
MLPVLVTKHRQAPSRTLGLTSASPDNRYDPTLYSSQGRGSRASVLADLAEVLQRPLWQAANMYIAPPDVAVNDDYLLNWNYVRLSTQRTSDGIPIVLPILETDPALLGEQPKGTRLAVVNHQRLDTPGVGEESQRQGRKVDVYNTTSTECVPSYARTLTPPT